MKSIYLVAAFALFLSGLAYAAGDHGHGHEHKPLHGGVVAVVKDVDYELLAKPDSIQLHLRDHGTHKRRPYVRFFACQEDWSNRAPDTVLPDRVQSGAEPLLIVGAMSGSGRTTKCR